MCITVRLVIHNYSRNFANRKRLNSARHAHEQNLSAQERVIIADMFTIFCEQIASFGYGTDWSVFNFHLLACDGVQNADDSICTHYIQLGSPIFEAE